MTRPARSLFLLACTLATGLPARAQVRASEFATVSQTIDGTVVTVQYSRPKARGRTGLYGGRAVPWNTMWTPGANWATTFEASRDVRLNGQAVPKGRYSVWFVPRDSADWTMILDPHAHLFHEKPPDSSAAQVRFAIQPQSGVDTDMLTWSFPDVHATGATLQFQWSNRRIGIDVGVTPSLVTTFPASDARAYVGIYDPTKQTMSAPPGQLVITHDGSTLRADFVPAHGYFKHFALVRTGPDTFAPGIYDQAGTIYEVLRPDLTFTFTRASARPVVLEARGEDGEVRWSGVRRD